jgi:eukaryotic-like serine/threonine-protein kinase
VSIKMPASSSSAGTPPVASRSGSVTNAPVEASPLSAALRPLSGAPGYFLGERFAAGGMGAVHFGIKQGALGFQRIVAIKRMHPHLVENPEFVTRFKHEIRMVSRLSHPNIVATLDVIETQGELCLVMEYVAGETLHALLKDASKSGKLVPIPAVIAILSQALHGLHAAHEASDDRGNRLGLVHRDVSPQNIMLDKDGIVKILDFGVAKATEGHSLTGAGEVLGKAAYMSPEQLLAKPLDFRSDIFATGVVLWEALTGHRLFRAPNGCDVASLIQLLNSRPLPPSELRKGVTPELDAIVLRALDRDPAQRFDSAHDFALALENAVPGATASVVARTLAATCGERALQRTGTFAALRAGIASCDGPDAENTASGRAETQSLLRALRVPSPLAEAPAASRGDQAAVHCTGPLTVFVCKEEATLVRRPHRSRAWALPLAALAVSLLVGGGWVSSRDASIEPTGSAVAPRIQAAPPPATPSAPSSLPKPEIATQNDVRPEAVEAPSGAGQLRRAGESAPTVRARSAKPASERRPAAANCSPPSYLDAQGIRHFKRECL